MAETALRFSILCFLLQLAPAAVPTTDTFVVPFTIALSKLEISPSTAVHSELSQASNSPNESTTARHGAVTTGTSSQQSSSASRTQASPSSATQTATTMHSSTYSTSTFPHSSSSASLHPSSSPVTSSSPHSTASSSSFPPSWPPSSSPATVTTVAPVSTATTESPIPIFQNITAALYPWLIEEFALVEGFTTLSFDRNDYSFSTARANLTYHVYFTKSTLFNKGLLAPNSSFIQQLGSLTQRVTNQSSAAAYSGYIVDDHLTARFMRLTVQAVNGDLSDTAWICAGIRCSQPTETCYGNVSLSAAPGNSQYQQRVQCVDSCSLFLINSSCESESVAPGVYVQGTCRYNQFYEPYCDCGMSPGDVMNNFYDGARCVSVTFVVAMAASAGGLLFLLLVVALCALCAKKRALKKARNTAKKYEQASSSEALQGHSNSGYSVINSYVASRPTSSVVEFKVNAQPPQNGHPLPDYDAVDENGFATIRM